MAACAAIASAFGLQQSSSAQPAHAPKGWVSVLNAYLAHDDAAKKLVDDASRDAEDPHTRQLAALLLDEWDFRSNAEALGRPRQVFMPKLPPDALEGRTEPAVAETFVFDVTISQEGLVTSAEFRTPPKQAALGAFVRARVLQALYRPVFDGREFISFPAAVTSTIEIK